MKIIPDDFFIEKVVFRPFNLNKFYIINKHKLTNDGDPRVLQSALDFDEYNYGRFGGYGEYRGDVWGDTYLKESKKFIHLGVDINMPFGTRVITPVDVQIVDIFKDKDEKIGWGGRVILKNGNNFLVLAHLNPDSLPFQKSPYPYLKKGDVVGTIGTFPTNGNTFEHLHVQVLKKNIFSDFDGYGHSSDLIDNPNPFDVDFTL
jgi:murein DD-endopeptidase MepM/ murein hydrolase activator NlpD